MGPVMALREVRISLAGVPRPLPVALAVRGVAKVSTLYYGPVRIHCPLFLPRYPIAPESAKQQQTRLIPQSEGTRSSEATGRSPSYQSDKTPRSDEN